MHYFEKIIIQVEDPLFKMLWTRNVSDFRYFWILEYLHTHNEISLGDAFMSHICPTLHHLMVG
jgi:hypothetical protein